MNKTEEELFRYFQEQTFKKNSKSNFGGMVYNEETEEWESFNRDNPEAFQKWFNKITKGKQNEH